MACNLLQNFMGYRYHSVGKGNGTPRTKKGKLEQLKRNLANAENELKYSWSKVNPKVFETMVLQGIEGLRNNIEQLENELQQEQQADSEELSKDNFLNR